MNIVAARAGGGYEAYTGTSFSAPLVTGAAALMMEWGIVRGNDPYMYGEKLKAHLRRGARSVRGRRDIRMKGLDMGRCVWRIVCLDRVCG